jgi:hypothetical protein
MREVNQPLVCSYCDCSNPYSAFYSSQIVGLGFLFNDSDSLLAWEMEELCCLLYLSLRVCGLSGDQEHLPDANLEMPQNSPLSPQQAASYFSALEWL